MKRAGLGLALGALFFISSLSLTSKAGALGLVALIQTPPDSIAALNGERAQAIVVLTGGYARTREAARWYRETGLPVLSAGGDGEAALLKQNLQNEFAVPVRWTEDKSLNTEQNALFCAEILAAENIKNIVLVTDALHMRRAKMMFSDQGLNVMAVTCSP